MPNMLKFNRMRNLKKKGHRRHSTVHLKATVGYSPKCIKLSTIRHDNYHVNIELTIKHKVTISLQ